MKKILLFFIAIFCCQFAYATDLLEVYQQAQNSDPIFQQAIAQRLSTREGVPISAAALLPNINVIGVPLVQRSGFSGSNLDTLSGIPAPRNNTLRTYSLTLTITQTVFNFAQFSALANANAAAKGADATFNAAVQNLMIRVASAYFAVLKDEENLSYSEASKLAFAEQLDQVKQQYRVGLKTITDVYTAQASYDSAIASYIAAETALANDRENLRVLTGTYYPTLLTLSNDFPLITPKPTNVDLWVNVAQSQNWSIKAAEYAVDSARQVIHQNFAGHLPTVSVEGSIDRIYSQNINSFSAQTTRNSPGTETDRTVSLNFNVPIFAGGGVVAQTNQASYNYQIAEQQLEQTVRNTINSTRQSFNSIIAGISQVQADKQAIKSNISSLEGMEASYKVGTETLVDVLDQQQKLFQAQTNYATDRYAFINNLLALKLAAGTLSFDDLRAINAWLIEKKPTAIHAVSHHLSRHKKSRKHLIAHHPKQQKKQKKKAFLSKLSQSKLS